MITLSRAAALTHGRHHVMVRVVAVVAVRVAVVLKVQYLLLKITDQVRLIFFLYSITFYFEEQRRISISEVKPVLLDDDTKEFLPS